MLMNCRLQDKMFEMIKMIATQNFNISLAKTPNLDVIKVTALLEYLDVSAYILVGLNW